MGSIIAWHKSAVQGTKLPDCYIECNGQTLDDPTSYFHGQKIPELNKPDGTGLFIRGSDVSGVEQGCCTERHDHGGATGTTRPKVQSAAGADMLRVQMYFPAPGAVDVYRVSFSGGPHGTHEAVFAENHGHTIAPFGGSETRPVNMSMVWVLRHK